MLAAKLTCSLILNTVLLQMAANNAKSHLNPYNGLEQYSGTFFRAATLSLIVKSVYGWG